MSCGSDNRGNGTRSVARSENFAVRLEGGELRVGFPVQPEQAVVLVRVAAVGPWTITNVTLRLKLWGNLSCFKRPWISSNPWGSVFPARDALVGVIKGNTLVGRCVLLVRTGEVRFQQARTLP